MQATLDHAAVREPIRSGRSEVQVGASIGVARAEDAVGEGGLLDRAGAALLAGKGCRHLAEG